MKQNKFYYKNKNKIILNIRIEFIIKPLLKHLNGMVLNPHVRLYSRNLYLNLNLVFQYYVQSVTILMK